MIFVLFPLPKSVSPRRSHYMFSLFAGLYVLFSLLVLVFLRKSYARFATNEILPIEFGVMTTVVCLGGMLVYDEAVRRTPSAIDQMVYFGPMVLADCQCGV